MSFNNSDSTIIIISTCAKTLAASSETEILYLSSTVDRLDGAFSSVSRHHNQREYKLNELEASLAKVILAETYKSRPINAQQSEVSIRTSQSLFVYSVNVINVSACVRTVSASLLFLSCPFSSSFTLHQQEGQPIRAWSCSSFLPVLPEVFFCKSC